MEMQSVLIAKRLYWAEWNLPFRWIAIEPGGVGADRRRDWNSLTRCRLSRAGRREKTGEVQADGCSSQIDAADQIFTNFANRRLSRMGIALLRNCFSEKPFEKI